MTHGFVSRELARIHAAICDPANEGHRPELLAAQQALSWAIEPAGFRAPFAAIMGIEEEKADCPGYPHPAQFSDIHCLPPTSQ
jgi:hypothetical protein